MRRGMLAAALLGAAALCSPAAAVGQGAAASPALARPTVIPAADFAHASLMSGPMMSPDGTRLLAMINTGTQSTLGLVGIASGEARPFALPKGYELVSYRWAGNRRVLISVGRTAPLYDEQVFVTRLIVYDTETGKSDFISRREEGPEGDDILYVDPAGQWLLLSMQKSVYDYPSVFRVELDSGAMREVMAPRREVWEWYADNGGVVRAGIGQAQDAWSILYRGKDADAFRQIGGDRIEDLKAATSMLRFAQGTDQGFILSSGKSGRTAVYRFDFDRMAVGEEVFSAAANDVSDIVLTEDGREIRAAYYTDERARVVWFDPRMKKIQAELDRAAGDKQAWIVSRSKGDEAVLVLIAASNDPGTYYYYRPAEGRLHRLADVNDKLKGQALAAKQPVRYRARDGLEIQGYLTLPPGRDAKGLPLIVMPHGGPFGVRDSADYDAQVQLLANRGYAVLQPNYRGSESYGREFEEKGDGEWGRRMQDDLDDGMDWLVAQGIADPKRVCIVGSSYGGYAALWGATRNPERYRCAASFAGISDVARQLRHSKDLFSSRSSARKWRARVAGEGAADLAAISPEAQVARLKVPVLVAHGSEDQRVPARESILYAKALARAGKRHEFHLYKGEGHGFSSPAATAAYYGHLERFLKRYNPAD